MGSRFDLRILLVEDTFALEIGGVEPAVDPHGLGAEVLHVQSHLVEAAQIPEALGRLETEDKAASDVVKLRFFAGLTIDQTAEALGLSTATVSRHWTFARTWLYQQIANGSET